MAAAKTKTTRKTRAAAKRRQSFTPKKSLEPTAKPIRPVANVLQLTRQTFGVLRRYKTHFAGVILIYMLLNIVFVSGLGNGIDISETSDQVGNRLLGGLVGYAQLLGSSGATSQAAGVYQVFLNLFFSLAVIWSLRQALAGHTIRIRDAFYKGMYPLVPFILVIFFIGLQLLPMIIGTAVYQLVVTTGIASSPVEIGVWLSVALLTIVISVYFVSVSILALIIVTLPDMQPVQALKLARKLARQRRALIIRKLLFMPLILLLLATIVLLPLAIVLPKGAPWALLVLSPLLITIAYSYIYILYRELVGE